MLSPDRPKDHRAQALHYGSARTALVLIVPDNYWPDMWRMRWPDGQLSDMANLSRTKDAAEVLCERGPPKRDAHLFRWQLKSLGQATRGPLVRLNGRGGLP